MIGIVIPAHNEEELIAACVRSAIAACEHPMLRAEAVALLVVADSCTDRTAALATLAGAETRIVSEQNVGAARSAGAAALLARGARWVSFTDADTLVSRAWLADQLSLDSDAVCGTVHVDDWSAHGKNAENLRAHFANAYCDRDEHRHVHGANLGVSAAAYRRAGGFSRLACSEDQALVEALSRSGARIAWSAKPRVTTSARISARAKGGFADALVNAVAEGLASLRTTNSSHV
jgi:glycosyltransferase involved in cell wall biosynthesis